MHMPSAVAVPAAGGPGIRQLTARHWLVLITAAFLNVIDGFDVSAVAFAAGGIAEKWNLSPAQLGVILASAQFGSMIGALSLGVATDRFGRRQLLVFALLVTAAAMISASFVQHAGVFIVLRTISGLGVGLLTPLVIGYGTEFMPASVRGTTSAIIIGSFPAGGMLGGIVAAWLMPIYGWEMLFLVGGIAPLVMIPIAFLLPQSIVDIARRGNKELASEVAERYGVEPPLDERVDRSATAVLFQNPIYRTTFFAVALGIFLAAAVSHFLASWLPRIVEMNGGTLTVAALSSSVLHAAGLLGCISFGALMDRFRPHWISAFSLALGSVALVMLAHIPPGLIILAVAGLAGFLVLGGTNSCNTFASVTFPSELRVTVIGYTTVVARIAGILSPAGAGLLLSLGGGASLLFLVCAVAVVLAGAVMAIGGSIHDRRTNVAK